MPKPSELPEDKRRDLIAHFKTHELFCRESLKVRNLVGSQVPMILGAGQRKLNRHIRAQERANKPVRIVALKTRRSWFTTGGMAQIFHRVPFFPGRRGLIISNQYKPAGEEALGYVEYFNENYVPFSRHDADILLPPLVRDGHEKEWANGSTLDLYSADTGEVRGGGRHFALLDEVAFWRAAETTLTGAMNMVPKQPNTMVLIVSTANGIGGEFYDLCQQAQDPTSDTLFEFLFFGWLEHEAYRLPLDVPGSPSSADLQADLDAEEIELQRLHGATLEQLYWRRVTIATECRRKVDIFHQEYPTNPREAFLASGNPALDVEALTRHPVINGTQGELQVHDEMLRKVLMFRPGSGNLTIYTKPIPGRRYGLGADPSKGKDVEARKMGREPDYSVAMVVDLDTGEECALLRGRLRPGPFGEYCALLARYYNYAFMVPESNDTGFIDAILRAGFPEECIIRHPRDPSDKRAASTDDIGFYIDEHTRPWIITAADDAIRTQNISIHSAVVVSECQTFIRKPNGKSEHMDGKHDDCVFALGFAELARRFAPKQRILTVTGERKAMEPRRYGRPRHEDLDD